MEEHTHQISEGHSSAQKNKIVISKNLIKTIAVSASTVVIVLLIAGGLVWANRGALFNRFATAYIKGVQTEGKTTETIPLKEGEKLNLAPTIFTQESFVIDAVKKTNPAVVSIIITKDMPKYETYYQTLPDPFGGFGNFGNLQIPSQRQNGTEKKEVGGGSGFFVTSDGLIVTNRHVIEDDTAHYTVFTNDGKKHDAKVIARDRVLDVALIKIEGTGYPHLDLGDSDALVPGQSVIAIGNALGEFKNTVSVGVISGLSRTIMAGSTASGQSEVLDKVIQTDAAINPGNSGGPLLNLSGKVIGVNVAVAQGSQSIGFALPVNSIKSVIDSVKATGKIIRPYVGIRYATVTADLKERNDLSVDYGIIVQRGATQSELAVIPGSPADKVGIVENDIILEIDGKKLESDVNFASIIRAHKVGDTVNLKVLSKGMTKTVNIKLEAAPENQ